MYEARATDAITSVLNYREESCLVPNSQCWEKYRQGFTLAINDHLTADVQRVQQILWNLLSNAIKFTLTGGQVILRVWLGNNAIVMQVEDTGIGIPEHQLPMVFEKFQQLDTFYHRRYEDTGLGLALTKQLVELHGGKIEVESIVGSDSIFTVWLPRG